MNLPPRDIYGFGLIIVVSMMGHCQTPPFPENSMALQHDDQGCLELLRARVLLPDADFLWRVVEHCVLVDPEKRWSLARIGSEFMISQARDKAIILGNSFMDCSAWWSLVTHLGRTRSHPPTVGNNHLGLHNH